MQEPWRGDGGAGGKYPSLLEDFQTGTASMARKRHLASTARGFYCFCLTSTTGQLLHLALGCLEGSTMSNLVHRRRRCARIVPYMILLPGGQYARGWRAEPLTRRRISLWLQGSLFLLPTAAILFSGGLEGPAWQDWELRHRAAAKTRLEQRPMTEGPRRNAS